MGCAVGASMQGAVLFGTDIRLLLNADRIDPTVVFQIRSRRQSGFIADRTSRIPAGDRDGLGGDLGLRGPVAQYELDTDYLEHARRKALDEHDYPELP